MGTAGPFAESNFEKATSSAPVVTLPADTATLQYPQEPPLFVWEPVPGAKTYKLEIDDAADFIGATVYTTNNTSYTLTDPQTVGQSFYWRVQGGSAAGIATEWSPTRSYSVSWPAAPVLVAPADGTAIATEDVVFEWEPVVGAHSYQLQVSPNGDWANTVTSDVIVKSTRYSPLTTLQNNSYFWRVRARDGKSVPNLGPWSAERQFRRAWPDQPTLLTPAEASHPVTLPTFSWTPIDHASHYELQVSTDPNFSPGPPAVVDSCYTNHPSFTQYELQTGSATTPGSCGAALDIFEGMNPGTTYYWRVRGIDAPGGINGVFSDAQSFTYVPEIPVLSGPADGVTLSAPELDWAPVHGASKYEVTILKANGTAAQPAKKTYSTSHTPTTALTAADGPFRWYVRAMDTINGSTDRGGLVPNPASHRTFSLTTPATTSASPEPTAPADDAVSVDMPAMSWEPVTGAAKYQVVYGVAGSGIVQNLSPATLPYAGYTQTPTSAPATTSGT